MKKLEENFHEFLKTGLNEKHYNIDGIELTEELLKQQEAFYIPFGYMSYFLVIEDEKPVLYVHASTRMDIDLMCFVDEDSYECYDVFFGNNRTMRDKYFNHLKKVNKFKDIGCIIKTEKKKKDNFQSVS